MERPVLDTHQKAHVINMDWRKYGVLADIPGRAMVLKTVAHMIHLKHLFRSA